MHPLFESPKLDRELKVLVRDNFREFCSGPPQNDGNSHPVEIQHQYSLSEDSRQHLNSFGIDGEARPTLNRMDSSSDNEAEGKFSDDEDEKEVVKQDETDDDDDLPLSKVMYRVEITNKFYKFSVEFHFFYNVTSLD